MAIRFFHLLLAPHANESTTWAQALPQNVLILSHVFIAAPRTELEVSAWLSRVRCALRQQELAAFVWARKELLGRNTAALFQEPREKRRSQNALSVEE